MMEKTTSDSYPSVAALFSLYDGIIDTEKMRNAQSLQHKSY